jgi:hypothetical protein
MAEATQMVDIDLPVEDEVTTTNKAVRKLI